MFICKRDFLPILFVQQMLMSPTLTNDDDDDDDDGSFAMDHVPIAQSCCTRGRYRRSDANPAKASHKGTRAPSSYTSSCSQLIKHLLNYT